MTSRSKVDAAAPTRLTSAISGTLLSSSNLDYGGAVISERITQS
jgi:hypothetical protein